MKFSSDRITGLLLLVLGVALLLGIIPAQTEAVDTGWMRPQSLPNAMAVVVALCGGWLAMRPAEHFSTQGATAARAALMLGILLAGVWFIDRFGFGLVSPVLALVIMVLMGERRWLWLGLGAVAMPAAIAFAVTVLLERPLP